MDEITTNDQVTYSLPTHWLEELVEKEKSWESSGIVDPLDSDDIQSALNTASIEFVDQLRWLFDTYVERFNTLRGPANPLKHIKIFKIANTANDFILFRNSLKLMINRKNADVVSIGLFIGNTPISQQGHHELKAHVGPFKKITWQIHGEEVDALALVQEYLSAFIRQSSAT